MPPRRRKLETVFRCSDGASSRRRGVTVARPRAGLPMQTRGPAPIRLRGRHRHRPREVPGRPLAQ
eukprot:3089177-Alexandrium_andersonii.AAC.1